MEVLTRGEARMPGAMLEVAAGDPRRVRDAVLALPGVHGVLLVGSGAHVHVDDAALRTQQIELALAAAGVAGATVAPVAPTIEDLFVALLDRQDKAA